MVRLMSKSGFSRVTELVECLSILGGLYCDDLTSVVQLSQQWSAVNGKFKNLVVVQSHEASCFNWSSVEVDSNRCVGK